MPMVRQRYRRTDRQTDRRTDERLTIAIQRFALRASRGKNGMLLQIRSKYVHLQGNS